jgi:hypothetical protein
MKKLLSIIGLMFVSFGTKAQSMEDAQDCLTWILRLERYETFKMSKSEQLVSNELKGKYPNNSFPQININGVTTFSERGKAYYMVVYTVDHLNKDYHIGFMEYNEFINWYK